MVLSDRETVCYVAASLVHAQVLEGLSKKNKTIMLHKIVKKLGVKQMSASEVSDLFHSMENVRHGYSLALLEIIDTDSFRKVREQVLKNPNTVQDAIDIIKNDEKLAEQVTQMLKDKNIL